MASSFIFHLHNEPQEYPGMGIPAVFSFVSKLPTCRLNARSYGKVPCPRLTLS